MSKPMMRSKPAQRATRHAPTTPPAGPDSTVRTGSRAASRAGTIPPDDCITSTRPPGCCCGNALLQVRADSSPSAAQDTHSPPSSRRAHTRETPAECDAKPRPESPDPRSAASTRRSVSGFANENSSEIATASAPLARTAPPAPPALHPSARAESPPRRSPAPARQSAARAAPGTPAPAQTSRRAALRVCRPIAIVSSNPAVVTNATRAPVRSSMVLVPTVVPWRTSTASRRAQSAASLPAPPATDRPASKTPSARAAARPPR